MLPLIGWNGIGGSAGFIALALLYLYVSSDETLFRRWELGGRIDDAWGPL